MDYRDYFPPKEKEIEHWTPPRSLLEIKRKPMDFLFPDDNITTTENKSATVSISHNSYGKIERTRYIEIYRDGTQSRRLLSVNPNSRDDIVAVFVIRFKKRPQVHRSHKNSKYGDKIFDSSTPQETGIKTTRKPYNDHPDEAFWERKTKSF